MIEFHKTHYSKNTKKYLNRVVSRGSYNDNYFLDASKEYLSDIYNTSKILLTHSCTASLEISAIMLENGILVKLQYQNVKAPVSGIIFNSNAYPGGVLNSGETIVSIVPQEGLKAEVFVPNKDIGYIKVGKPVKVRVDAFPFARYGELSGSIKTIGADALPPDNNYNYYRFPVTISLDKSYLEVNNSKIPLKPGMA